MNLINEIDELTLGERLIDIQGNPIMIISIQNRGLYEVSYVEYCKLNYTKESVGDIRIDVSDEDDKNAIVFASKEEYIDSFEMDLQELSKLEIGSQFYTKYDARYHLCVLLKVSSDEGLKIKFYDNVDDVNSVVSYVEENRFYNAAIKPWFNK